MGAELTVRQKILVSGASLVSDVEPFNVEDLIVKTWQLYPDAFSLRGYHGLHPDSNKVLAKLSGTDGLCGMGWMEHVDSRMYRVTRKGRTLSKQLLAMQAGTATGPQAAPSPPASERASERTPERAPRASRSHAANTGTTTATTTVATGGGRATEKATGKATGQLSTAESVRDGVTTSAASQAPSQGAVQAPAQLSPKDLYALEQVVKADALRKFLRGQSLSFNDACAFWGFTHSSRPVVVQQRIDETSELLKRAVESFGTEGGTPPRMPSLSTCFGLLNLHRLMADKFVRELDALRLPLAAG